MRVVKYDHHKTNVVLVLIVFAKEKEKTNIVILKRFLRRALARCMGGSFFLFLGTDQEDSSCLIHEDKTFIGIKLGNFDNDDKVACQVRQIPNERTYLSIVMEEKSSTIYGKMWQLDIKFDNADFVIIK